MPTSIYVFVAVATALWLAGITACLVALRWSSPCRVPRFGAALVLCAGALVVGYLGFTKLQMTFTRTVNGQGWSISSKWFFLALILLAAVSLSIVCWRRFRPVRDSKRGERPTDDSVAIHPHG